MKTEHKSRKGKKAVSVRIMAREPQRVYEINSAGEVREIDSIRSGMSYQQVRPVQSAYHATDKAFAHMLGISDKTLLRLKKPKAKLSALSGDRVYRLKKTLELAALVLESEDNGLAWLGRPQPGLGGQVPLEILDTEPGYEQVLTLLNQLQYGVLP